MNRQYIDTPHAPAALGPYSQAVKDGEYVFFSGQIPLDPDNPESEVHGNIKEQTVQVLENIHAILSESGLSPDDVVKTTVFMTDLKGFAEMNEVYALFFKENRPARSTVEVSNLPKNALLEIELVARMR